MMNSSDRKYFYGYIEPRKWTSHINFSFGPAAFSLATGFPSTEQQLLNQILKLENLSFVFVQNYACQSLNR